MIDLAFAAFVFAAGLLIGSLLNSAYSHKELQGLRSDLSICRALAE